MAETQNPEPIITGTIVTTGADRNTRPGITDDAGTTTTRAHSALVAMARAGQLPPEDLWTLAQHWTDSLKPHTGRAYREAIRAWLAWCSAVRGIDSLRAVWIDGEAYAAHLATDPSPRTGKPLSDSSRRARLSALASWYGRLAKLELVETANPFDSKAVDRPFVDRHHSTTVGLSKAEAAALLKVARADRGPQSRRTVALIALLLTCALRVSEATGADVEDLTADDGLRVLIVRGKGGKIRTLPIASTVGDALDAYLDGRTSGPLFVTQSGGRLDQAAVWRLVQRLAFKVQMPHPEIPGKWVPLATADRLSPHSLRHTAITIALNEGAPLRDAQDLAGHASSETTRRYDLDRGKHVRSTVYKIAAALEG